MMALFRSGGSRAAVCAEEKVRRVSEPSRQPKAAESDELAVEEVNLLVAEGRDNGCLTTGRIG